MSHTKLVSYLHDIDAIKVGQFKLKNGTNTPIYIEFDPIISFPHLLTEFSKSFWELAQDISTDRLCAVPYTAIPIATCLALEYNIPMLLHHKSSHSISGNFQPGQTCLVVEDIISSGHSVLETITELQQAGLMVKDIIALLDREQGAKELLAEHGYHLHSLFTLTQFICTLAETGKIDEQALELLRRAA